MDATIHVWRCDGCGEMLPGPDLDLDMAKCKCETGRWRVCSVTAEICASMQPVRKAEDLAAANLAANRRIVELEHERDAALLAAQGARRTAFNAEQKAKALDAVQRDTIARLEAQVKELRAELARLTMPRPIVEAPRDGTWAIIHWSKESHPVFRSLRWRIARYVSDCFVWVDERQEPLLEPTHFLPLPEVKP